jgi:hypothetical protein
LGVEGPKGDVGAAQELYVAQSALSQEISGAAPVAGAVPGIAPSGADENELRDVQPHLALVGRRRTDPMEVDVRPGW